MKKLIVLGFAWFSLFAGAAQANLYSVYVTSASHVSPTQVQLNSLVQHEISIDTAGLTVRFQLRKICAAGLPCPMIIENVFFNLNEIQIEHDSITSVKASGPLLINGHETDTHIEMNLSKDNSMSISITSSSGCKSMNSVFVGGPAEFTGLSL